MIEKGLIKTAGIIVGSESLQDYVYKDKSIKCFSFLLQFELIMILKMI